MTELYTGHEVEGCAQCNNTFEQCQCPFVFVPETEEEKLQGRKEIAWLFEE